jgi:hypothetical protein
LIQSTTFDGFMLQVPISDAYVRELEQSGAEPAMRFPLYPLPFGLMLALPTLQAGTFQRRVAVRVVDRKACDWVQ